MSHSTDRSGLPSRCLLLLISVTILGQHAVQAAPLVPGTGVRKDQVGDDFEDPSWRYATNLPKSSRELDQYERRPWGKSQNGRLLEGPHRGTPDVLMRIATPEGGLPGSEGALLIRTLHSGIPGKHSFQQEQDDLLVSTAKQLGGFLSVARSPNVVVRVYMPPFEQWENRSGTSFALRTDLRGIDRSGKVEQYWPGIFVQFRSKTNHPASKDSAYFILRAQTSGHDFKGPEITQTGWWTMGMSVTPDGQVHFYASPGVDDLTPNDYLGSRYCYGFQATQFHTFFFNVVNRDDGLTWSTPWIIDDPQLYVATPADRMARR